MISNLHNFPGLADAPSWLVSIVGRYETFKQGVAVSTGANDWLLHVNGGMLIVCLTAIVFRRNLASAWPFVVTAFAEGLNEYFDRLAFGSWRWDDTRMDIFFTLVWPLLLMLGLKSGIIKRD